MTKANAIHAFPFWSRSTCEVDSAAMVITGALLLAYNWLAIRWLKPESERRRNQWWAPFEFRSSLIGIVAGGWSHVVLDSIMHADIQPLAPFTDTNELFNLMPLDALHLACLLCFVGALVVWGIQRILKWQKTGA